MTGAVMPMRAACSVASPSRWRHTCISSLIVAIVVDENDPAIRFFVDALGFEFLPTTPPSLTNDGRPKRSAVVVRPRRPRPGPSWRKPMGQRKRIEHRI